ncbi:MAG: DnaD domain protein [Chloroflexi bacterium]|nr:DnaD domain protein [Chloroflexota bacterium]
MSPFSGFPNRMEYTPIPNLFFTAVLPHLDDPVELRAVLVVFSLLARQRHLPRMVRLAAVAACAAGWHGHAPGRSDLLVALRRAVARGVLLELAAQDRDGREEYFYLLNTERNRRAVTALREGRMALAPSPERWEPAPGPPPPQPNIFTLYQDNIGLITPIIADELRDAEQRYPTEWIAEAFAEAVAREKRYWRYIARILERWAREGKGGRAGTHGGHPAPHADPRASLRGPYAHLIKH